MRRTLKSFSLLALLAMAGLASAGNFVDSNSPLPALKVDRFAPTDPTRQWSASDANTVINALADLRTVAKRGWVDVRTFGADPTDNVDDGPAIQAAIAASQGRTIYFPKGKYIVGATLNITSPSNHFVGDLGQTAANGGTEIQFQGTGPCFQVGTDDGNPWNANEYNGPQDQVWEDLAITHGVPDTTSDTGAHYKAGAQGIWDWRGGGIKLNHVRISGLETAAALIQSDIDRIYDLEVDNSKFGVYVGPRSDQFLMDGLLAFSCDRAVTIDGAREVRIRASELVGCGDATASAIEIRQGSGPVQIEDVWNEHIGDTGYTGTDGQSCYSVGEVAGYGTGGSISSPGGSPTTTSAEAVKITDGMYYITASGVAGHLKYMASVGKATRFQFRHPGSPPGIGGPLGIDFYVGVQAGSPSSSDTQINIDEILQGDLTKALTILSGTPAYSVRSNDVAGTVLGASTADAHTINGKLTVNVAGGQNPSVLVQNSASGATTLSVLDRHIQQGSYVNAGFLQSIAMQGQVTSTLSGGGTLRNVGGQFTAVNGQQNYALETVNGDVHLNDSGSSTAGTTTFHTSVLGTGTHTACPSTGTHVAGEIVFNADPVASGKIGCVCVTGGSPGTWKTWGAIDP